MINRNAKFLVFLLFLLIITIPISFAEDNLTGNSIDENLTLSISEDVNLKGSDDVEILRANDVYFDASASTDGVGSKASPYKTITSSKLGTNNHFAPGTYRVSSSLSSIVSFSSSAMTFEGTNRDTTIIQYTGTETFLSTGSDITFSGLTLKGCSIVSTGGLFTATNTIFDSGKAKVELESDNSYYDNSYGGAIKQSISASAFDWGSIFGTTTETGMKIDNCIFRNNFAAYGGAIYVNGGTTTITNTKFESNHATNYGGSIAAVNGANITLTNCEFTNDYSDYDAAGGLYLFNHSKAIVKSSSFNGCRATFGSAITSLNSTVTVSNSNFNRNRASWQGGAIYAMFGHMSLTNSNFSDNAAKNGGAVFADNLTSFTVTGGNFAGNIANDTAGAIFAFANVANSISTSYNGNVAGNRNDLYQTQTIDLVIGSDDYEMMQFKSSYNGVIPSRFDLRSLGDVTPVKNQGQSGNCWAFATIATLESAILKATGKQYILSEGNLKNLAQRFSDIGWDYETNNGGQYQMALGYLTSWAGPVNISLDPTDDWDVLAPILDSVMHVQNILFIQRTGYTDNDVIKRAIMNYGAVASEIYWSNSYLKGTSDYYYDGNLGRNHAISVVGWDDSKTVSGAPGAGAWIIKNSYGTSHGDKGYYYVSYYDHSLFRINDESYNSYAFILNDTVRYNKNYQYDASFTDYFITGDETLWYKNTFTSTGSDILSAFSTYFKRVTNWEAKVYLNGQLKLTQSGKTQPGYYTIPLSQQIPLQIGDEFTIELKINSRQYAAIPISEPVVLSKDYAKYGISFFSKDGSSWTDLYNYKSSYGSGDSGHNYFSQVACIKAFTTEGPKSFLNTTVELSSNSTSIFAIVMDQFGGYVNTGSVIFDFDGKSITEDVINGKAIVSNDLSIGTHEVEATYVSNQLYNQSKTSKTIQVDNKEVVLTINTGNITYGNDLIVNVTAKTLYGQIVELPVIVEINGRKYSNGDILNNLTPGNYTIHAEIQENSNYRANAVSKLINVKKISSNLKLEFSDIEVGEKLNFKAILDDVEEGTVYVKINGQFYEIKVEKGVGTLVIEDTLKSGNYSVMAEFRGNEIFLPSHVTKFLNVWELAKVTPNITISFGQITEGQNAIIKVSVPNDFSSNLILSIDGNSYGAIPENGQVIFNVSDLTAGNHAFTVGFEGDDKYNPLEIDDSIIVISKIKNDPMLIVSCFDVFEGDEVVIKVVLQGDITSHLTLMINGENYTSNASNGQVKFTVSNLPAGEYGYLIIFDGDDSYKSDSVRGTSKVLAKKIIIPTIEANDAIRAYLSGNDFEAKLIDGEGNILKNVDVNVTIDGNVYRAKTDNSGILKLNARLTVGKHNVTVENPITGEKVTKTSTIVKRIVNNNDLVMDYYDGSSYKVTVYGDGGKVAGAGEKVVFTVNKKTYSAKTNSKGIASLKIKLVPKKYQITAAYKGVIVKNKITVKNVIKSKNVSKKKAKKIKYSVTLKTSKGKALANKKVSFKINGKTYASKTNKKGVATVSLKNLKVGNYIIKTTYLKSSVSNKIKIKK